MTGRLRPRRRRGDDRGFTLTELLVVIMLFGVIGSIVTTAATTGLRHQTQLQDRSTALSEARVAVQRVDRDIRSASQVDYATASKLVMQESTYTGSTATGSEWVCYYTTTVGSDTELIQQFDPTSDSCPSTSPTLSKVLVHHVVNAAATPVFAYSPIAGFTATASSVDSSSCAISGSSPASYAPSCIGTITVHLLVQPSTISTPVSMNDNGTEVRNQ